MLWTANPAPVITTISLDVSMNVGSLALKSKPSRAANKDSSEIS